MARLSSSFGWLPAPVDSSESIDCIGKLLRLVIYTIEQFQNRGTNDFFNFQQHSRWQDYPAVLAGFLLLLTALNQ